MKNKVLKIKNNGRIVVLTMMIVLNFCISVEAIDFNSKDTFNEETTVEIKAVEKRLEPIKKVYEELDVKKNIVLMENGRVIGELHTDGYKVLYNYKNGHISEVIDNKGSKVKIEYKDGYLVNSTYFNGKLDNTQLDQDHSLKTSEDIKLNTIECFASTTPTLSNYLVNGKNMSNLMSDSEFCNKSSMTQAKIQELFKQKGSILQNEIAIYYLENGKVVSYGEGYLASRGIYNAAQSYGVNPKVILCTMQKESSIITKTTLHANMRSVYYCMGYGATDSGDDQSCSGIDNQIAKGTKRLKELYNESNWSNTLKVNAGKTFTYKGITYPAQIIPANRATHALYRWTPWVFDTNQAPFTGGNYLFLQVKDMFWTTWN